MNVGTRWIWRRDLTLTFTLPQFYYDIFGQGLSVIEDLVFDRAAAPDGGWGPAGEDPSFPIRCIPFAENRVEAHKAKAMVEAIAELANWPVPNIKRETGGRVIGSA